MWQKVEAARKRSSNVRISPQKNHGVVRGITLLIPLSIWPEARSFDLFVNTEAQALRVQEGSSYIGSVAKGARSIRLSCMQALNALGIPAPPTTITPPFKWHDGGLEIDLSQWKP